MLKFHIILQSVHSTEGHISCIVLVVSSFDVDYATVNLNHIYLILALILTLNRAL